MDPLARHPTILQVSLFLHLKILWVHPRLIHLASQILWVSKALLQPFLKSDAQKLKRSGSKMVLKLREKGEGLGRG